MSKVTYNAVCLCRVRHPAKSVLKELAWFANDGGEDIWPAVNTIAERTGLSRRAVQKILRELEGLGAIHALGSRLGGRGRSTRYRINLPWLQENAKTANGGRSYSSVESIGMKEKGEPASGETANGSPENGELGSPEQKEHENEKKGEMLPLRTGQRQATPYEYQRVRQKGRKVSREMSFPGPLNEKQLQERREMLRQQIESCKHRAFQEQLADSNSRLP